jgi:hypothetical protein
MQAVTNNVVCWGWDEYGQVTPPNSVNGISGTAIDIALGDSHSCATQASTDNVICWGYNYYDAAMPPDDVNGELGTAAEIAAGRYQSVAIVPEPSALLGQLAGATLLGVLYRRKRN